MKKHFLLSIITFSLIAISSCSKKEDNSDKETEAPTAKAEFDNSNCGIYKGVFVGSSGIIIININNDNTIAATLTVDGVTTHFTTTQTVQQGEATSVDFTSSSNSFTFSVDANGANPVVTNINFNGHPSAAIVVVKETSTMLVKCYEGTFTGTDEGTFNVIVSNKSVRGLAFSDTYNITYSVTGTVLNNQITTSGSTGSGASFSGSISGDKVLGSWDNSITDDSGSWSGKRTL